MIETLTATVALFRVVFRESVTMFNARLQRRAVDRRLHTGPYTDVDRELERWYSLP